MSAIQIVSTDKKQVKRVTTSFDKHVSFSQGYSMLITDYTSPSIYDVVLAGGVIQLPNAYPMGRGALRVSVNGLDRPRPIVDYTEDTPTQITLSAAIVSELSPATPANTAIFIEWNRYLPGTRDQSLEDLIDVTPDVSAAVRDPGALRTAPATASNVLITQDDLDTAINNFAGLTVVPVPTNARFLMGPSIINLASGTHTFDFKLSNATLNFDGAGFIPNNTVGPIIWGGSGNNITVPSNARWMVLNVGLDIDYKAPPAGINLLYAYAVRYGGTAVASTNLVSRISINTNTEINGDEIGNIFVEMNNPSNPTADLNVTVVITTPGLVDIAVIVRLDGFLVEEQP